MNGPIAVRAAASLLVVALMSGLVAPTFARLSSTTVTGSSSFSAGTVTLDDNDLGSAVTPLTAGKPGDVRFGCIRIHYGGSLPSSLRLYAQTSGSLRAALHLTVTRGSDPSPSFNSCSGFVADATDYAGAGAGVVYSGGLDAYPGSYAAGLVDPNASAPETWTTDEAHSYRFEIVFDGDETDQGESASASFIWEARNQ